MDEFIEVDIDVPRRIAIKFIMNLIVLVSLFLVINCGVAVAVPQKTTRMRIKIRKPNSKIQAKFVWCTNLRQIIKAGRQLGKTVGAAIKAASAFVGVCFDCKGVPGDTDCPHCHGTGKVAPQRVLYAAPTEAQVDKFWYEVTRALADPISKKIYKLNKSKKEITLKGTDIMLKAKTAYDPDSLRGGTWQGLILEEYQLMKENVWGEVAQPMLARYHGWCVFIFTPPRLGSKQKSWAEDPRHASKLFKKHVNDKPDPKTGVCRWLCFHGTSYENPDLSKEALDEMLEDMTQDAYRREIMAQDDEIETMWMVNHAWRENICYINDFEIPKNWPVKTGHDFGPANTCMLASAEVRLPLPPGAPEYMPPGSMVIFVEDKPLGTQSNRQHVQSWEDKTEGYRVVKSVGGNKSGEDQIRQGFTDIGWPIYEPVITGPNSQGPQIEHITKLQENNNIYLFKKNKGLFLEFANMMFELDDENMPTKKIANESKYHYYAALRYLAAEYDGTQGTFELPEPEDY